MKNCELIALGQRLEHLGKMLNEVERGEKLPFCEIKFYSGSAINEPVSINLDNDMRERLISGLKNTIIILQEEAKATPLDVTDTPLKKGDKVVVDDYTTEVERIADDLVYFRDEYGELKNKHISELKKL